MQPKKIFLASSFELLDDRKEFEIFINRKNNEWVSKGVHLKLIVWEDFLDALSQTRLQDEYNKEIRDCDVFVMLFCTKVGPYTEEEFETAFGQFKATNKPFIYTYFKDAQISTGSANQKDLLSLWAFQEKLKAMGHFYTSYKNIDALKFHFNAQLDKLVASGFIEFKADESAVTGGVSYHAINTSNGAIAQGGGTAVGAGGVYVGGQHSVSINTDTQTSINTDGGAHIVGNVHVGGDFIGRDKITYGILSKDLEPLFAPLLAAISQQAPAEQQSAAVQQVEELKVEVAKGEKAEDGKIAKIIDGLTGMVPGAIGAVVSMFTSPILGGIAGPVTKYVLDKLNPN